MAFFQKVYDLFHYVQSFIIMEKSYYGKTLLWESPIMGKFIKGKSFLGERLGQHHHKNCLIIPSDDSMIIPWSYSYMETLYLG